MQSDLYDMEPGMYNGMGNDPVNRVDPTGGWDWGSRVLEDGNVEYAWFDGAVPKGWTNHGTNVPAYWATSHRYYTLRNEGRVMEVKGLQASTAPTVEAIVVNNIPDKPFHISDVANDYYLSGKYETFHDAWLAANAHSGYHPGEKFWDRFFRNVGQSHREEMREFGGGGYNMFAGSGRALKAVEAVGEAASLTEKTALAAGGARNSEVAAKLLTGFGKDEIVVESVANLASKRGWYDVVVHGASDGKGFIMNGKPITAGELYSHMLADGYQQGTKIRLISCWSGSVENGAAFQLSKMSDAMVVAPTRPVFVGYPGSFIPLGKPYVVQGGVFKVFRP